MWPNVKYNIHVKSKNKSIDRCQVLLKENDMVTSIWEIYSAQYIYRGLEINCFEQTLEIGP